ncbi:hypothetical protein CIB48_g9485 [Xylaria polymorpha]|nr:hypothetical protein CIB48_g9485 [Xylaria polymorpha]
MLLFLAAVPSPAPAPANADALWSRPSRASLRSTACKDGGQDERRNREGLEEEKRRNAYEGEDEGELSEEE